MTDASYRTDLSGAILKLKENGIINELQHKWWKQKRGGDECEVRDVCFCIGFSTSFISWQEWNYIDHIERRA